MGGLGGGIKELSVRAVRVFLMSPHAQSAGSLSSKQHEFYTGKKKSLAGQLSLGVTTETGHRVLTSMHHVKQMHLPH